MEKWRDVSGYEGIYQISNHGRLRSLDRVCADGNLHEGQMRKAKLDRYGYLAVGLYVDGEAEFTTIHRLVAEAFLGPCPEGKQVNHKDGDKTNNYASNLEYVTVGENLRHKLWVLGRRPKGVKNSQAKLDPDKVREIRKMYASGKYTQKEIAEQFNVHRTSIGDIVNRKNWKHIK